MKNLLLAIAMLFLGMASFGQTYNPTLHTPTNKAIGIAQDAPTDARSKFYDAVNFKYRAYVSTAEVLSYLNLPKYRAGQFDIIVNSGGTLNSGVITGGTNYVYYFKDGTADGNLVRKSDVVSVNGQIGVVVAKNADSLLSMRIDTSTRMRNNYVVAFDSTNRKWVLAASGAGASTTYTPGTGIDITNAVISAANTSAIWNASQLRGRSITSSTPSTNQILKYDGTTWENSDDIGVDSGYISGTEDTVRLIVGTDTVKVFNIASKEYADSIVANIPLNPTVSTNGTTTLGDGSLANPIRADTLNYIATITMLNDVNYRIDTLTVSGSGITSVVADPYTFNGTGITGDTLKIDTGVIATKSYVDNLPGITPPDGSETNVDPGSGIAVAGTGTAADPYIITATGAGTTNPFNALDIRNYGGVANAVTPASGANATGTNCTPALNAMLTAAGSSGTLCIVPDGEWLFSTAPDTISSKRLNLVIYGNTHHNQQNFIVIKNNSGAFKQHRFQHWGIAWGRENLPSHTSGQSGTRVSPTWSAYTGTFFTVYNTDQVKVWFNKVTGFAKGLEVLGGGGNGAQENEFRGGWIAECAIGISLRSLDGSSFVDKNKFFVSRIGGGLCLKIDGYSGTSGAGQTWDGAFRSDEFHFLVEFADSAIFAWGDITEPLFNITIEGGTWTGILGSTPFDCKLNNNTGGANSSNNYVRGPKWTGQGYYDASRLGSGSLGSVGINGTIKAQIWNGGTYYGSEAIIDASGQVNIFCTNNVSNSTRNAAPSYIKFMNYLTPEISQTITASSYTAAASDRYIYYNNSAGTLTLPTASTYPTRRITVVNIHTSGTLTISNVKTGFQATLAPLRTITYRSNGTDWYPDSESEGDGFIKYVATTTASSGSTLASVSLPQSKGIELEVIIMGYRTADQTLYRTHLIKGYATTGSTSSLKTSTAVSSHTSDFTPATFSEQAGGTLTYTITVSSVSTETINWVAWVKMRSTSTTL